MVNYGAGTIASLVIAIMSGSLAQIIPQLYPLDWIYLLLFEESLPPFLYTGMYAVGLFSLFYSIIVLLLYIPMKCSLGVKADVEQMDFSKIGKEDLIFVPLLYGVYLLSLYSHDLLTVNATAIGIIAIMIVPTYRLTVHGIDKLLKTLKTCCMYPLYLFAISFTLLIPVSVLFLLLIHALQLKIVF